MSALMEFARRYRRAGAITLSAVALYAFLGAVVLPWLLPRVAGDAVRETYGAELRVGEVALNPFVLSLRIDELALDDPDGAPFLSVDQVFVNFQLSSLFRLAWTFDEIRIDGPRIKLSRDAAGELNAAFFAAAGSDQPEAVEEAGDEGGLPKLLIFSFAINDSIVDWQDRLPPEPVETRLGPVDVNILQLNTLPSRSGEQSVVIATETQGTLSWSGSLQLNPVRLAGRASVKGSHFPLISAYLRHQIGFEIHEGDADLEFAYDFEIGADGGPIARIDDLGIRLSGVRVRPYKAGSPDQAPDTDTLQLPRIELQGGEILYPQRTVSVRSVDIVDLALRVARDADGFIKDLPRQSEAADDAPAEVIDDREPAAPWRVSLDRFLLDGASVDFRDATVTPEAQLGIESTRLRVSDISNAADAEFPLEFGTTLTTGGRVTAEGRVTVLPVASADLDVNVDQLALSLLQPYLQAAADVSLDSGTLGVAGALRHAPDQPLSFSGDAAINDLLVRETEAGSRLGSWRQFNIAGIDLDLAERSLAVDQLAFDEPYVDVLIAEDGSINIGRAGKDESVQAEEAQQEVAAASEPGFDVVIGGVEVAGASARFADLALPLPFETEIAELNGSLSTISTSSSEPAEVALEGAVDAYGRVRVTGSVTPLDPPQNTDLHVLFENVEMPKMSAYTIPFAGREIASGRLDLDLGYRVEGGSLVGENSIVLRDFELGDRVPHPDAVSLPLGLAVALLKDTQGNIDIDLPVRGEINDPEFSYGAVVRQALTNLIVRIAASPFALLGNLLGVEADELEYLSFDFGRRDLSPPEREKALKLAEALALRPELVLEIPPTLDEEADRTALKAAQLDAIVDERLALPADSDTAAADRRMTVLESIYEETSAEETVADELEALRAEFLQVPEGSPDGAEPRFDALAYSAALERRLAEQQQLDENAMSSLAGDRAETVRQAILAIDTALDARIVFPDSEVASSDDADRVRMRVALSAGQK